MKTEYLIKRMLFSFIAFFISMTLIFTLLHLMPGDYLHATLPALAEKNPLACQLFQEQFGLNKSIFDQYILYIVNILQGNWGYSIEYGKPVLSVIGEKLQWTLIILLPSTILSIIAGIIIGSYSGWKSGSKGDITLLNLMVFIGAVPSYWWAILLILTFGFYLNIFPLGGYVSVEALESGVSPIDVLHHAVLPIIALFLASIPGIYYLMRNSMLQTVGEDYILTARSKGLSEMNILRHHALKNSMLPMVTVIALDIAHMIMGSVFIETIFSWPGLGYLTYHALQVRDLPLLQGIFLIDTLIIIFANILADVLYPVIDPRVMVGDSV